MLNFIQTLRAFRRPHPTGLEGLRSNQIRSKIKVKSSPNRARRPHGSSRWLQNGLRTANLATKTPTWSPTWLQDDHKDAPREAQGTSWDHLGPSWEALGEILEASRWPFGNIFERCFAILSIL